MTVSSYPTLYAVLPERFGKALEFDGVDDYVDCGRARVLTLTEKMPSRLRHGLVRIEKLAFI
jgi:hypothetical protein